MLPQARAGTCREEPNSNGGTLTHRLRRRPRFLERAGEQQSKKRHGDAADARPGSHDGINLSAIRVGGGGGEAERGPSPPRPP